MYSLYFDGASKHNPGPAGCGCVIYDCKGEQVIEKYYYLGNKLTNNQAEYKGLIYGLEMAKINKIKCLAVYGDSLLVINQMKGTFTVRSENLKQLYIEATKLINFFNDIKFFHIPREQNKKADSLANKAIELLDSSDY
jgi:ribonuclease HI